nr:MAG: DNA-directed RNA polymerase N-terminal [Bacteriophage sp.]
MEHRWLSKEELQLINERQFNRKHIDGYIRAELFEGQENLWPEVAQGVELLKLWMDQQFYDSKAVRINHLKQLDLEKLVIEIFVGVCYVQEETPLVNVIGQLASRIGFDDKRDSIQTIAEVLAVLCETDVFDIKKPHPKASLYIQSNIKFDEKLTNFINYSCYLPPLVCEPRELVNNRSTAYYTHENDSLILGGGFNHHDGNICLDVLNSRNRVPLSLDVEFLCTVEEEPTHDLNVIDTDEDLSDWQIADMIRKQKQNWARYKEQSYYFYSLMVNQGNRFYISNKVDKRGRMYACGYHITPQGTSFKKAMINLADKEQVSGVPDKFKRK